MKPRHQRLIFVALSVICISLGGMLVLSAFRDNIVFFFTPTELLQKQPDPSQRVRVGGLVEAGSVKYAPDTMVFVVTDGEGFVSISFKGSPPALFREGQGIVAEGYLEKDGTFDATTLLAKHDENYMPREVMEKLKASGRWREGAR